ncbi:phosphate ABC transporter substrate-binding protein [Sphingomonas oryzagri]|uniref:Phosphate ABC transporter substrate-binding protein n=1 Tax=Sphingomonas oryzagri TaxID=3042314 RepID=A0ABT6MXG0_9SPHN|nr:phosphate ABC transporter substrate-binding protein [Sphingomonas oryzagri]MDH7637733.1 phosphate ABC transporter substrate-binding protein [Sphingomonas oryzagri]
MPNPEATVLKTLLGRSPRTEALIDGQVRSDRLALDFDDVRPTTNGFPAMVREMAYDFGELALLTFLQARAAGKPLVLLPFVAVAEPLHDYVYYNGDRGELTPERVAGKRIGVRSYTQTTGLWVRGFLEDDHGVPLEAQRWISVQEPHVREYREPDFLERAPKGSDLLQMLIDGEIDVLVGLQPAIAAQHPQLRRLFPEGAAEEWSRRTGILPINHMAVLKQSLHDQSPEYARELFRMLSESKMLGMAAGSRDNWPSGIEANRRGMELLVRWAVRQQLIPEAVQIDALFDEVTRGLGA